MHLPRGSTLGSYRIEEFVAAGGMGDIYKARHADLERWVAIKIVGEKVTDKDTLERFRREARSASRLEHPHICRVYDFREEDDRAFLVLEYLEGETLAERITRDRLNPVEALRLGAEVAEALDHAHRHGLVHRDLKPANVMLTESGAKVLDFGIAKRHGPSAVQLESDGEQEDLHNRTLTREGAIVGTLPYMAPEQVAEGDTDARTDVHAIGVLLYEALTGRNPFESRTQAVLAVSILRDSPQSLQEVAPGTPARLARAVHRCLEKSPDDRWPSAGDLAKELRAISGTPRKGGLHRLTRAVIVGLMLILLAYGAYQGGARREVRSAYNGPDLNSIAVLPLEDRSTSQRYANLGLVLADLLIDAFYPIESLSVVSSQATRPYARDIAMDSVGTALGVGTIVSGYIEETDDSLRVAVRLIEAQSGRPIGDAIAVTGPLDDEARLRAAIIDRVARDLRRQLGDHVTRVRWLSEPGSPEAWELVEAAETRKQLSEEASLRGDFATARQLLVTADSLAAVAERTASSWVEPTLLRGWLAFSMGRNAEAEGALRDADGAAMRLVTPQEFWRVGVAHADEVLDKAPTDARGLELRGALRLVSWDYQGGDPSDSLFMAAESDLAEATAVRPALPRAWMYWSLVHRFKGQLEEAALAALRSIESDAYVEQGGLALGARFFDLLQKGDRDGARIVCETGRAQFPDDLNFKQCRLALLGWYGSGADDVESAQRELDRLLDDEVAGPRLAGFGRMMMAATLARSGRADSAVAVVESTLASSGSDLVLIADHAAFVFLLLGDDERAIDLLREDLRERPEYRSYLEADPRFAGLRNDPTFRELIRREER